MQRKGVAVGLVASLLGACASPTEPPAADGNGPPPACADRSETYADDHVFPLDPGMEIPGRNHCVPRCGAEKRFVGEFYGSDALPAGTCASNEVACSMAAHEMCPCPTNRGPVSIYQCSCNTGKWTCVIVSRGASSCLGTPSDSGNSCPRDGGGEKPLVSAKGPKR